MRDGDGVATSIMIVQKVIYINRIQKALQQIAVVGLSFLARHGEALPTAQSGPPTSFKRTGPRSGMVALPHILQPIKQMRFSVPLQYCNTKITCRTEEMISLAG